MKLTFANVAKGNKLLQIRKPDINTILEQAFFYSYVFLAKSMVVVLQPKIDTLAFCTPPPPFPSLNSLALLKTSHSYLNASPSASGLSG